VQWRKNSGEIPAATRVPHLACLTWAPDTNEFKK